MILWLPTWRGIFDHLAPESTCVTLIFEISILEICLIIILSHKLSLKLMIPPSTAQSNMKYWQYSGCWKPSTAYWSANLPHITVKDFFSCFFATFLIFLSSYLFFQLKARAIPELLFFTIWRNKKNLYNQWHSLTENI